MAWFPFRHKEPYTNYHDLNLDYFIGKFEEIFAEWESLYNALNTWKDETTAELEAWKTSLENDIDNRETALRAELAEWKTQTETDISTWETATLSALDAWKTATTAIFEAIRAEAAGSATAAANSATAAGNAKTAAETAQAAAEAAAASVAASAAQIAQNQTDIAYLETAVKVINPILDITWTLNKSLNSSGEEYTSSYQAVSNVIPCTPGDVFITTSPTTDDNNKFLVYFICEYSNNTFIRRTELTNVIRSVTVGETTNNIRIAFGRYGSSGVNISQNDIDTYVEIELIQKAAAEVDFLSVKNTVLNREPINVRYSFTLNSVDDINENTIYFCQAGTPGNPTSDGGYFVETVLYNASGTAAMQIGYRYDNGLIYYRRKVTNTWRTWISVTTHSMPSDPLYYAFGDSITWGAVWTSTEESPYYQINQASIKCRIPTRIANAIGAGNTFVNYGVGGSYFVGSGDNKIIDKIEESDLSNAKIVTIAGGRNDSENPLGDKTSTIGDGTICGAIKEIIEYLQTNYKKLQIVWIGVTPNANDNDIVFTRVFAGGWSLNTFDEKVAELCADYCIPYVNWKDCTFMKHWADYSGAGGVYSHPNDEECYLQMGNYIAGRVASYYRG